MQEQYGKNKGNMAKQDIQNMDFKTGINAVNRSIMCTYASMRPGAYEVILVGEIRSNGEYYSMYRNLSLPGNLHQTFVKQQHNTCSGRKTYRGTRSDRAFTGQEMIDVIKKPSGYEIAYVVPREFRKDLRDCGCQPLFREILNEKGENKMTDIYYADLFEINNKGCLVMGYGKTKTCRNYTGASTIMLVNDSVRLDKVKNELYGYADASMGFFFDPNKALNIKIEYMLRMLSEEETAAMKCDQIIEVNRDQFASMSDFNITFACKNVQVRRNEFKFLTDGVKITYILVPWCEDMATKGSLISQFVK